MKAVFLDRDGTVIVEKGYITQAELDARTEQILANPSSAARQGGDPAIDARVIKYLVEGDSPKHDRTTPLSAYAPPDVRSNIPTLTAAAREVVKLIRKLRWIGLEREAEQLQTALGAFPSDKRASLLAGPHSTD